MSFKKEKKTVITFPTTSFALEAERLSRKAGLPGRLIPVPSSISAGCGMAWCAPPEQAEAVIKLFNRETVTVDGVYELEI